MIPLGHVNPHGRRAKRRIASALGSSYAFRTAELLPVSEIVRQTWITDLAECRALAT